MSNQFLANALCRFSLTGPNSPLLKIETNEENRNAHKFILVMISKAPLEGQTSNFYVTQLFNA